MYFAPGIFKNLGFDKNDADLLAQGINGIVNFLATVMAFFIVDRVGRRTLLIAGGLKYVLSGGDSVSSAPAEASMHSSHSTQCFKR